MFAAPLASQLHFHTFFPLCKAPHSSLLRLLPADGSSDMSGRNGRHNTELCCHARQLPVCSPLVLQLLFSSGHGSHSVISSYPLTPPFLRLGPTLSCAISTSLLLGHSQEHKNFESICHSLKSPPAESQEPLQTPEHVSVHSEQCSHPVSSCCFHLLITVSLLRTAPVSETTPWCHGGPHADRPKEHIADPVFPPLSPAPALRGALSRIQPAAVSALST